MRRTARLALVAGMLVAVAGGGVATSATVPERGSPPGPVDTAGSDPAPAAPSGRDRVGAVEQVERVLGYLDTDRSATFHYPGSDYVKLHISRLLLLPGDHLTVSDPAGEEVHRYRAESLGGGGWATSITGDTAVVTLHRAVDPLGVTEQLAGLGVTVDKVARGLRPEEAPATPDRTESLCGSDQSQDAICYQSSHPTVYRNTKAVARLLIDGVEMCTAFRVGDQNRLLTNHHCLSSSRQAQRTEVWFNYQCASCGGWAVFRPTKVRGDRVIDTDRVLDFTLFSVDSFAKVAQFGHLELASSSTRAGAELYIPQHPSGLPGRVAMDSDQDAGGTCAVSDPRANGYGWNTDVSYYCDTAGGSSGSPVLSRSSHQVIALHHFGGCPNSGVRMDLIRPRIASKI